MSNLDTALAYAEAGFFVFPCGVDKKTPATSNGVDDATRDPELIRAMWHNKDFNIAICPGMSGHCVVDIDPPDGFDTLHALLKEHKGDQTWVDTFQTQSPRGGIHYWFKGTARSTTGKSGLGLNIDTRSIKGYVLAPPSWVIDPKKGIDGGYETVNDKDIQDLPAFVAEMTQAKVKEPLKSKGEKSDQDWNIAAAIARIKSYHPTKKQGADGDAYKCFCRVREQGISGGLALELVIKYLDVPWEDTTEKWLTGLRDHVYEYGQNDEGAKADEDPNITFGGGADAEVIEKPAINLSKYNLDGKPRFYAYTLEEAESFPDPEWIIPNLLPAKDCVLIFGPPKSFKSFLTLDMCLGLGAGVKTFEYTPEKPCNVLYIAGEGPSSIAKKHVPAWCKHRGIEKKSINFHIIRRMVQIAQEGAVEEFILQVQGQNLNPDIVIIDTMARATRGIEENSPKEMGHVVQAVDTMKNSLGATIISIHHTGKDVDRGSRGTNVLEADFATTIVIERHERTLAVKATVKHQRDAPEREEPYYFMGEIVGNSVVFNESSYADYSAITKVESKTDKKFVHAALEALGAKGRENAVPTMMLAMQIDPGLEAGSKLLQEFERGLKKAAAPQGRLEAYSEGRGQKMLWFIPG